MVVWSIKFEKGSELRRYGNQLKSWLQIELPKLTRKQAEEGKDKAVDLAPKQTYALVNAIGVRKGKDKEYTIVSRTPKGKNNPKRVPYQVYLHAGKRGWYEGTKKTGDHNYMDSTYNYLKNRYPDRVERALDKQINK